MIAPHRASAPVAAERPRSATSTLRRANMRVSVTMKPVRRTAAGPFTATAINTAIRAAASGAVALSI